MLRITKWRPDTCDCILEYQWDDEIPEGERTHSITKIVSKCPAHQNLSKENHFTKVTEENRRKNNALGLILEKVPDMVEEVEDQAGNKVKQLKKEFKYNFSFDSNRNLEIEITGIDPNKKQVINGVINSSFEKGKVRVK